MSFGGGADLGSARGEIVISTAKADAAVKQLQGTITQFGNSSGDSFNRVATGIGLLAGAKAIGGLFTGAIGSAADFEQQISAIGAVSGATGEVLDSLRDKALQIGKDTSFSASEAASALEELIKAGVSVEDVLNGAADGATALAAAGGVGIPEAATIVSNALNIFSLAGDQATHVADVFAAAANKSATDIGALGQGMAQVGSVADGFGLSIEETAGALALFADNGLQGSDAGTSFKTALISMLAPVGKGADTIAELGLNFRDINGEFIGTAGAADELRRVLGPLSKDQRDAALVAIFGTDALRVGNILYKEGGKNVQEYTDAVNDTGAANRVASERLDNFNGSLEALRGSLETAAIIIGTALLPPLRELIDVAAAAVNAFIGLPGIMQGIAAGLVGAAGGIAGIAGVMTLAGPKAAIFADSLKAIRVALLGTNPLILAVVAALALIGIAYKTNFGGFADFVNGTARKVRDALQAMTADLHFFTRDFAGIHLKRGGFGKVLGIDQLTRFQHLLQRMGRTFNKFNKDLDRMALGFKHIGLVFKRSGVIAGLRDTFGKTGLGIIQNFVKAFAALPETIGVALRGIRTGFAPLDRLFFDLGRALQFFGGALEELVKGKFRSAIAKLGLSISSLFDAGRKAAEIAIAGLRGAVSLIKDVAVAIGSWIISQGPPLFNAVKSFITDKAWPAVKNTAVAIADALVEIASWAVQSAAGILDAVTHAAQTAWDLLRDTAIDIGEVLVEVSQFAVQAGAGIFDAISTAVQAAWGFVKNTAIDLGNVLVSMGEFVVQSSAGIYQAVSDVVQKAWGLVKSTAIDIADVAINVVNWVTDQLQAGTLVTDVTTFVQAQLATVNVFMDNWTLRVGAPGSEQITVDFGAIFSAIFDALTVPLTVDPENEQKANQFGQEIGAKFVDGVLLGIKTFFMLGGGSSGGASDGIGIDKVARAFFGGIFTGIDNELHAAFDGWLNQTGDAIINKDAILGKLRSIIIDPFLDPGAQQGFVDAAGKVLKFIVSLFTWGDDDIKITFPDIITPIQQWISEQVVGIGKAFSDAIPDWLKALAHGDVMGAVRALFPGGSEQDQLPDTTNPGGGGGIDVLPQFDPIETKQPFTDAGTTLGKALGDGVVAGIGSKKTEVQNALIGLANQSGGTDTNDTKSTLFTPPTAPDAVVIPAPDISEYIKGLTAARKVTKSATEGMVEFISDMVNPVSRAALDTANAFKQSLSNGLNQALQNTQQITSRILNVANGLIRPMGNTGDNAGRAFATNLVSAMGRAVGGATNAATAVRTAIANVLVGMVALGYNAGVGVGNAIANGIYASIGAGVTAAWAYVNAVRNVFNSDPNTGRSNPFSTTSVGPTASSLLGSQRTGSFSAASAGTTVTNQFTVSNEFHGVTDTAEIESRVNNSLFRALDRASAAGVFGR